MLNKIQIESKIKTLEERIKVLEDKYKQPLSEHEKSLVWWHVHFTKDHILDLKSMLDLI